ncbi:RNA polymerase subunit lef-9 [Cotesia congregata filamentous virus 1]|uniref:RNA polymerase subunit lef-9 n=1 Tax=Cotesia congregata filamentous virus 1 TaxID=3064291 RepID=A0ABC8QJL4_9VIRU|nr:RNA polymerase subunit lef-9 [Cotesia congregata filamentous virus 1]
MLRILSSWWLRKRGSDSETTNTLIREQDTIDGYLVKTKYPYVYKMTKKKASLFLTPDILKNHRVLYIPSMKSHSRESIKAYKNLLTLDTLANFVEFCKLLHLPYEGYDLKKKMQDYFEVTIKTSNKVILYKKILNLWNARGKTYFVPNKIAHYLQYLLTFSLIDGDKPPPQSFLEEYNKFNENETITFKNIQQFLDYKVSEQIHDFKDIIIVPLRNGTIKSQVQGRRSHIRRKILSPKIKYHRLQILLCWCLLYNEIILPIEFLKYFGHLLQKEELKNLQLYDLTDPNSQPGKFIDLGERAAIIIKRDPVIDLNSAVLVKRVAFAKTDLLHISPYILIGQNADFDGDAENFYILCDRLSVIESSLRMSAENNIYNGFFSLKLQFTETHIYFMHKVQLPESCKYKKVYDAIRNYSTVRWFSDSKNITTLVEFFKDFPGSKKVVLNLIEPTKEILEVFSLYLYVKYGSYTTLMFFNQLNDEINKCSNFEKSAWFRKPPTRFVEVSDNFFNVCFLKTVLSGAKGSLQHYRDLLKNINGLKTQKKQLTGEKILETYLTDNCLEKLITENVTTISNCGQELPKKGHAMFKATIEFNGFVFYNNDIYYKNIKVVRGLRNFLTSFQIFSYRLISAWLLDDAGIF